MRDPNSHPLILYEDEPIGIPHVPSMIWAAEQEHNRELLDRGICPRHQERMVDWGDHEDCPYCEAGE